jgi:type III restriction enzyme
MIDNQTLEQKLSAAIQMKFIPVDVPDYIKNNLNQNFQLRPYQIEAFARFIYYVDAYPGKLQPTQLLFHMATGSGKTLIMAGCMLHLYTLGYRNFIFFVNSNTIIEKTKDNFLNTTSSKYLFAETVSIVEQKINIKEVDSFEGANDDVINIVFTTIHGLHSDLNNPKENSLTYEDFEDKKIVLISDEAHHINADTKNSNKLTKAEKEDKLSWKKTVTRISDSSKDNYLLEFTATADLAHAAIAQKYKDKLIFDYPLKQFKNDLYSKDVKILQAEIDPFQRALQAIILSQYRRKVFEKNSWLIKPVVLFKSKKIDDSSAFFAEFIESIKSLSNTDLEKVYAANTNNAITEAKKYFDENGITSDNLIQELKEDFAENKCISVDSKSDSEEKQLIINSLEDENNEYRAVFAVDKLNEGWDVLNLFDIVRLYDTRDADTKTGKVGKTTMSEAQLIGRGARYCPFKISEDQDKFKRKFDKDLTNPLRICEELFYHAAYNPKYIYELNQALEEIGMKDSKTRQIELFLKPEFKKTDFYKNGIVYVNKKVPNQREDVKELPKNLRDKVHKVKLATGFTSVSTAFQASTDSLQKDQATYKMNEIDYRIRLKAIHKLKFYRFNNLKKHFPHLESLHQFITSDSYANTISIELSGTKQQVEYPTPDILLEACIQAFDVTAKEIQNNAIEFRGSKSFTPKGLPYVFKDKLLNITVNDDGDAEYGLSQKEPKNTDLLIDLGQEDWYAHNDNYGTSEEKYLVKFIKQAHSELSKEFEDVYLLRNERFFKLFAFDDATTIEPDFVLYLKRKVEEKYLFYQVFIEPIGQHLMSNDKESKKQEFLLKIEEEYELDTLFENKEYKLVGMPFYNETLTRTEFSNKLESIWKE